MNKEEIIKILEEVGEEVKQKYKAEIKGIFGSYVRGEEKEDSDVDVLVDFEEGADLFDFVGTALFLEDKLHRKVDVVTERSLRKEIKPYVLKEIVYL